jgi:6,7-dimethyl-8-ribityllumazine synthase
VSEPSDWPFRDLASQLRPPGESRDEEDPPPTRLPTREELGYPAAEVEPEAALPPLTLEPAPEPAPEPVQAPEPAVEHVPGAFRVPDGYDVLAGDSSGGRRSVAVVVSRFNGEITNRMLARALEALEEAGVARDAIVVMPVPGAFELPLAAMALAKTRRYSCIVALGAVIRGETSHFDFVAGEAASGLQLAAIETGIPIAFGVLTTETAQQAEARIERAADAVRSALEMADLFARLRATVQAG